MIDTIQDMDHYIRTAFGDSEDAYRRGPRDPPPQGMLQGNGAGPAGWSAISTVIINVMKSQGFGYNDWSLIRRKAIEIVCFAFVDDTDLIHVNHDLSVPRTQLIQESQSALDMWEGLIRATGGDLAPEKSYWYLVEIQRKNGQWAYVKQDEAPADLWLKNGTFKVQRKDVSEAAEALGIQSRPDGKMIDELKYLKGKVAKWCDAVRTKRLHKSEAWYCLNCTIMKTIEYPLMATTFTRSQIDDLMRPLLKTALPLSGVQSRLPRKLVYGTLKSRGLNIKDPYWTQLIHHWHAILRHHHRSTPTGVLLDDNMDIMQVHVGSEVNFWEMPYEMYSSLAPDGWVKHTWEAQSKTAITPRGVQLAVSPERPNDQFLMDVFLFSGLYNPDQIQQLQDCRLFLRVTTLSHICTADGTHIHPKAWNGRILTHRRRIPWINTYRPGQNKWDLWRNALRTHFLMPYTDHLRLRTTLGQWYKPTDEVWKWWKHPTSDSLLEHTDDHGWMIWNRSPEQAMTRYTGPIPYTHPLPNNRVRVQVCKAASSPTAYLTGYGTHLHIPDPLPDISFVTTLENLPPDTHWALAHIVQSSSGSLIAEAILSHTAVAVSDGSLKLGYGTSAFAVEGNTRNGRIVGVNEVPGPIKEGDSHRCEMAGIYAILVLVNALASHFNLTQGSITVACDNQQAIDTFDIEFTPNPAKENFDMVNAVWAQLKSSPIQWKAKHVKGHLDDPKHKLTRRLTRLEKLNVEMDTLAKAFWHHQVVQSPSMHCPDPTPRPIFGEGWQLWAGTDKITHPSINLLYSQIQDPITQCWWVRHGYIKSESTHTVDWNSTADFLHHLDLNRRRWVTKHASDNCGVGMTLQKWKYKECPACPRCNQPETTTHVYKCTGFSETSPWTTSLTSLQKYLTDTRTDPSITEALVDSLVKWRTNAPIILNNYPPALQTLLRDQHALGWKSLLEGLPVTGWKTHQQHYYHTHHIRKSSRKWMRGLLTQIHHLAWNQWQHRNDVKFRERQPDFIAARNLLHREIRQQLSLGEQHLLPGDRHLARWNQVTLLTRTMKYKKAWLCTILQARKKANALETLSRQQSLLLRWMKDNRPVN